MERAENTMSQEGRFAEIGEIDVRDDAAAQSVGLFGSPMVRIDGLDVEPLARNYSSLNRKRLLVGASVAAAIGSSLCCVIPIAAVVTGLGTIAAGAVFETWRPYLLGVTGILLGAGLYFAYRDDSKSCAPGILCAAKPAGRRNFGALALAVGAVVALAAFPYYSGPVAQALVGQSPSNSASSAAPASVTFRIPDMDCPACAVSLSAALNKLPGVATVKLDVDSREAVVSYDPAAQNIEALQNAIIDAGFRIAPETQPSGFDGGIALGNDSGREQPSQK